MSGLETFQDDEVWRKNLKEHLLTKRQPKPKEILTKTHTFNVDIVEDFKALHESIKFQEKMKKLNVKNITNVKTDLYNLEDSATTDSAINVGDGMSNESFEAFERMCDKTGSDPDNTLFHYLHSKNKDEILSIAKQGNGDSLTGPTNAKFDTETEALRSLLNGQNIDCTLLENVDAPSRLWDNSILNNETTIQTSPIKMIGLLRPSTIIEGCEDDSNPAAMDTSSTTSYFSSQKNLDSNSTQSCYETANDVSQSTDSKKSLDVDDLFYAAISKVQPCLSKCEKDELLQDLHESVNLIDLEKTFITNLEKQEPIHASNKYIISTVDSDQVNLSSDESVIELSDDESDEKESQTNKENDAQKSNILNKINFNERVKNDNVKEDNEKKDESLNFNDTMEEVEYLMRKGLEYMASTVPEQTANITKTDDAGITDAIILNNISMSPLKAKTPIKKTIPQPKPLRSANKRNETKNQGAIPKKTNASSKIYVPSQNQISKNTDADKNHFELEMKYTKREFFKSPIGIPSRAAYSHIVSPIRTYRQKTGTIPLMTYCKPKCSKTDVLNSTAYQELEKESRLYQPMFRKGGTGINATKIPSLSAANGKTFPKKAYISSELKHVTDERTPITIPGGKKMQKYLESAMVPTILRHDGKMKLSDSVTLKDSETSDVFKKPAQRNNQSLANLSVMSGDISLYTMKDAQNF